jgi:hypothetical protein
MPRSVPLRHGQDEFVGLNEPASVYNIGIRGLRPGEAKVFPHAGVEKENILADHRHPFPPGADLDPTQIKTIHENSATGRIVEPGD